MFRPVSSKPDFVAQEITVLDAWRERRTFSRLRAQNAGGPRWSFLDGPITANNPMGVHHAWGRAYKDLFQRFHAMLGEDQRYQNGFDCQGLWVEVNVERDLGFTSKRDIEAFGIDRFVTLCKQRVLTYAARQTEQSVRLGMWMDWNDPDELRRLGELLGTDPAAVTSIEGPAGPVTDTVEMLIGRLGMPDTGGSYFTFSNENNDLIWGFLAECHRRGWLYKGHDTMPWCARCGTGLSQTEMNEGYQDREDPGLTVRFPLVDRPGESLLVWTTTPWTLTSNVAAAVGPAIRYVRVRQGKDVFWLGKGTLKSALSGPFEVLDEADGADLVGWRYSGPFDHLPAVKSAFAGGTLDAPDRPYDHRIVPWTEVGEDEGTGIVHIAPGCGAEDFQLGRALGLPVVAPLDESGIFLAGFGSLSGRDVRDVSEPIIEHLKHEGRFYRLETITHRYPHCWRCGTPLVFRLVDEWFISMGPLYDQPRESLTADQVDASLRYQIMDVVDRIRWIPDFGHERELDWLRNMHDWMISKKRYWGLALPIYPCEACGTVDVIGGRQELHDRAVEGWQVFDGHTPHRPYVDAVKIACPGCGTPVERIKDVGNPWLDAGIVPFSTLHFREDPDYWRAWFPADFITESFPGQFRNWFYSMLAMSTVLRREPPFMTIFGYATLFAEDGRPMHKSSGNTIEFDDAADRMGVDVMRWMFAKARPEENILFGWHAADEARRELLILWNVYSFFVTYANRGGWTPAVKLLADSAPLKAMDRWILSRTASVAYSVGSDLRNCDALRAARSISEFIDDLSTWYLRLSRQRVSGRTEATDKAQALVTLHYALLNLSKVMAPMLPFMSEEIFSNLAPALGDLPDSVHLTGWPSDGLAKHKDPDLEAAMAAARTATELARQLRSTHQVKSRQRLAEMWVAVPSAHSFEGMEEILQHETNVAKVHLISDDSSLVQRRLKAILPKVGKRLGPMVPSVMQAGRDGDFALMSDGTVRIAGVMLDPGEYELYAVPLPGRAVAEKDGIVVVLDVTITPELAREGDAREATRFFSLFRRQHNFAITDHLEIWPRVVDRTDAVDLTPIINAIFHLLQATTDVYFDEEPPPDLPWERIELSAGALEFAWRRT